MRFVVLLLALMASAHTHQPTPCSQPPVAPCDCEEGWTGPFCNITTAAEHYYALAALEYKAARRQRSPRLRAKELQKARDDETIAKAIEAGE